MSRYVTPYVLEETPAGRTLVVTGAWSDGAATLLADGAADGLTLNYARGFSEASLEFLEAWPLRRLEILARELDDLSPVSLLGETLEELSVEVASGVTVDLGELPRLRALAGSWDAFRDTIGDADGLRSLITLEFDEADLSALSGQARLERLTIKDAPHLESLVGLGDLPALSVLEVILARELADIGDLRLVAASLRELEFETCLSIDRLDSVPSLLQLRFLGVNDCGRIESLEPLAGLRQLATFHAWESTRIVDGDLSPLLRLPLLAEVRMRARREYRPSLADVVAAVDARRKPDANVGREPS